MSKIPQRPTTARDKPQPDYDSESFFGKWGCLIFVGLFMVVFWGIVLHDIYSIFKFK